MITTNEELRVHLHTHDRQNSWWEYDARGIPLCRVCSDCVGFALDRYAPEVLGLSGNYTDVVEEQIDDDY